MFCVWEALGHIANFQRSNPDAGCQTRESHPMFLHPWFQQLRYSAPAFAQVRNRPWPVGLAYLHVREL